MQLTKYQQLLVQNVNNQLHTWFDSPIDQQISFYEITHFLVTTKFSANSVQLIGLEQICDLLIGRMNSQDGETFSTTKLSLLIEELIDLSIEWNHFDTTSVINPTKNETIPLIYLIEDDVSMIILLKDVLENLGYIVIGHTNPDLALKQLYDIVPDCIIVDADFPTKSGVELLTELNYYFGRKFIPKLVLSSVNNKNLRIAAFRNGADDFITKPIEFDEFTVRLKRHLDKKEFFDQSVLMDELTQVYNRKYLKEAFSYLEHEFERNNQPYAVAILDLDFFKRVNDTYGHLIGDKVLIFFAQFLKQKIRPVDTVCRFGGEEFVLLFPNTTGETMKKFLASSIEEFKAIPFRERGEVFHISFSAGICAVENEGISRDLVLNYADQALYVAKNSGRSKAELATNSQRQHVIEITNIDQEETRLTSI